MILRWCFLFLLLSAVEYYLFWETKGWDHCVIANALWIVAFIEIVPAKPKYDERERKNL